MVVNPDYCPDDYVIIGSLTGDRELIFFSKDTGRIFTDNHDDTTDYDDFNEVLEIIIEDIKCM